jgi:hypothetical protein
MDTLAKGDASWASNNCQSNGQVFLTILDFGQPAQVSGVYGSYDLNGNWDPDSTVASLAQEYAKVWFNQSSSCPALQLVIGTNNYHECPYSNGGACSVTTAGSDWFTQVVLATYNYINSNGWAWQEHVWGGDDIEGGWDQYGCPCASAETWQQTQYFLNGWTSADANSATHFFLADYGDAAAYSTTLQLSASNGSCPGYANWSTACEWSWSDFYQAAWSIGWDIPLPEAYLYGQVSNWTHVTNAGTSSGSVSYYGVVSECSGSDVLQEPNCWVQRNNQCEYGPDQAMTELSSVVGHISESNETNIQWQGSSKSTTTC